MHCQETITFLSLLICEESLKLSSKQKGNDEVEDGDRAEVVHGKDGRGSVDEDPSCAGGHPCDIRRRARG